MDSERHLARELVAHQLLDQRPVGQLVVELECAVGVDQRLHAGVRLLHASGECALRDLDEFVDQRLVRLQVLGIHDHRIAVGVEAGVAPREEAHVVAEFALEDVVDVVERSRHVDRLGLQCGELGIRIDIDPGHRFRVDIVGLGERRPHHARAVAGRVADLLAGEVLDAGDARALEPVHALRRIGIHVEHRHGIGALALGDQHAGHVGQAERRRARADALRRQGRALARLEVEVDAFLGVPAELPRVVVRRVVAARHPVEDEVDLGRRLCLRWREQAGRSEQGGQCSAQHGAQVGRGHRHAVLLELRIRMGGGDAPCTSTAGRSR